MTANRQGTCRRTKSEFKGAIGNPSPGAPLAKAGNEPQRSTRVRSPPTGESWQRATTVNQGQVACQPGSGRLESSWHETGVQPECPKRTSVEAPASVVDVLREIFVRNQCKSEDEIRSDCNEMQVFWKEV